MNQPLLSIQIPTTPDRHALYDALQAEFLRQCVELGEEPLEAFTGPWDGMKGWRSESIEFMYYLDDKTISIGEKRDRMYKAATGEYSVQWDSDDWIAANGVELILGKIIHEAPAAIGYRENIVINGEYFPGNISHKYPDWSENGQDGIFDHFYYHRTNFFKTPIVTEICQDIGVRPIRFGEDHDFARRIYPYITDESYIDKEIYFYRHQSSEHNERYGIK